MTHDPGGKVRIRLSSEVEGRAWFDDDDKRRLLLSRSWTRDPKNWALWIGMNPSTADASVDDPTVQREVARTRSLGLEGYVKANVMDFRATSPKVLLSPGVTPNGPRNHPTILSVATKASLVVMAHGTLPKPLRVYAQQITRALIEQGCELWCLGTTQDGSPRHPLYISKATSLIRYFPTADALGASDKSDRINFVAPGIIHDTSLPSF